MIPSCLTSIAYSLPIIIMVMIHTGLAKVGEWLGVLSLKTSLSSLEISVLGVSCVAKHLIPVVKCLISENRFHASGHKFPIFRNNSFIPRDKCLT